MTKSISHDALDAAFAYIASRADTLVLCSGAPDTAREAVTPVTSGGRMICASALIAGLGNGDFAVAAGVKSGRRLVVGAQEGLAVAVSGVADHLALVNSAGNEVLLVTALTKVQSLNAG
jgi:hypothetical protein